MSLDQELAGRTVIVTGAASGIGALTVARLAAAGATVLAADRAPIAALPEGAQGITMDVTVEDDWIGLARRIGEQGGRIDGLVNGAGIIRMGPLITMALADFRQVMQINVEGVFLGMKHILPLLMARGAGSVINISSTAGLAGAAMAGAYCASKGAVRLLSKSAALEMIAAGSRVRVNSLHPALTETPMMTDIVNQLGGGEEITAALHAQQPSGRLVPVDAIIDAIVFLLSDRSAYMNGSELVVDNGFTAQ